jgi:hypothetical protein
MADTQSEGRERATGAPGLGEAPDAWKHIPLSAFVPTFWWGVTIAVVGCAGAVLATYLEQPMQGIVLALALVTVFTGMLLVLVGVHLTTARQRRAGKLLQLTARSGHLAHLANLVVCGGMLALAIVFLRTDPGGDLQWHRWFLLGTSILLVLAGSASYGWHCFARKDYTFHD